MSQDIVNAVQRFFEAVDNRDWDDVIALMTNPFHLDYSSYGAGPGADLKPAAIVAGWKGVLPGFDFTQHQLSPLIIEQDGETAVVRAFVTATHQIAGAEGGETWTVYGSYVLELTRQTSWKIASNTFQFKFLSGNQELPALARQRVAA